MHRGRGQAFCGSGRGRATEEEDRRKTGNLSSKLFVASVASYAYD